MQNSKTPGNFELVAVQGHPRSYATSCDNFVVILVVSRTIFEISMHKARK